MSSYKTIFAVNGLRSDDTGLVSILVQFHRKERKYINTGIVVRSDQWDDNNKQVVNHNLALKYNADIANKIASIRDYEARLSVEGRKFNKEALDLFLSGDQSDGLFGDFVLEQIKLESDLSLSTVEDKMKTLARLNEFNPRIHFGQLNFAFVQKFNSWLVKNKKNYAPATIENYHKNVKRFCTLAIQHELIHKHPYANYKISRVRNEKQYLTWDEVERIYNHEYNNERHRRAADLFTFQCCTAFRVSDLMRLKPDMWDGDCLTVAPIKTTKSSGITVVLPLKTLFNGRPFEIWDKYNGHLPHYADQDYNRLIRTIAGICGITKHISSHTGRHTALTNCAIKSGNVFSVMALGGLVKLDTAQIYIHLAEHRSSGKQFDGIVW